MRRGRPFFAVPCLGFVLLVAIGACTPHRSQPAPEETGELTLVILDAAGGESVPARVEVLDESGRGHVARDALPILYKVSTDRPRLPSAIEEAREYFRAR